MTVDRVQLEAKHKTGGSIVVRDEMTRLDASLPSSRVSQRWKYKRSIGALGIILVFLSILIRSQAGKPTFLCTTRHERVVVAYPAQKY